MFLVCDIYDWAQNGLAPQTSIEKLELTQIICDHACTFDDALIAKIVTIIQK